VIYPMFCYRDMELRLLKFIKRFRPLVCLIIVGFSLSACFSSSLDQLPSVRLNNIDGQWVDANGIASSFNNGVFETRSGDTNEKLAEGNYIFRSNDLIELEIRSLVRGTVSRVNCLLVNSSRLLCKSQDSSNFALTKRI